MNKIIELMIDWENLEFEDLGVDVMSIVDRPAIGVNFLKFEDEFLKDNPCQSGYVAYGTKNKNGREVPNCIPIENNMEFESYNDYPESAKNNAQRALDWAEENGWGSCGTDVGKQRANQLAKGENISEDTIARMASFARHKKNSDTPYSEGCGKLMWDAWGGTSGIEWAQNKLKTIRQEQIEQFILQMAADSGETLDMENTVFIDGTKTNFENVGDYLKGIVGLDILGRQDKDKEPETKYRYAGPSAQRNFCKAMLRMNKIYTMEELDRMSLSINTGFRHDGQAYSIFDFKGGVNCNHYWEELETYKEGRETVVINKGRVSGQGGRTMNSMPRGGAFSTEFRFSDDDEMIVVGPCMIPDQMILRKDEKGNPFHVFFAKDTVKKIAQKFFEYNKQNNTDINHDDDITQNNTLLESWIVEDPDMDKSKSLGFNVPSGTWMASYKINDVGTWNKIKEGDLNGFSIAGNFIEKASKK